MITAIRQRFVGSPMTGVPLALLFAGLTAGCGSGDTSESAAEVTTQTSASSASGPVEVEVTPDPDNSLILHVEVRTDEPSGVVLQYASADTAQRALTSSAKQNVHGFTVVGLRAETEYAFAAARLNPGAKQDDKMTEESAPVSFPTGALPEGVPEVEASTSAPSGEGQGSESGITFFGVGGQAGQPAEGPEYVGVDPDGQVVWYLDSEERANPNPVIRDLGNGEVLAFFADSIQQLTLSGEVVRTWDMSGVEGWHHDAVLMPGGGVLALAPARRTIDGADLRGDTIAETDENGEVVWEWSSFEHLDTSRFPGELSTTEARTGGLDWTHANAVFYDEKSDEILLSSRSQGWVVNIDHATGEIRWIAGDSVGVDAPYDAPFLTLESGTWTTAQHAATWTADGDLLVYDNRNESGGETDNSRAVIYDIDAEAGTASQTFEHVGPKYTRSLGDVDELDGGNILMTSGGPGSDDVAHLIEVNRDGDRVWEATTEERIYRSERMPWADIAQEVTTGSDSGDGGGREGVGGEAIDLTDALLTSTDPGCGSYAGTYTSSVTDVPTGQDFTGALEITADDGSCTLASNQIPNHDLGEGVERRPNDPAEVEATFVVPSEPAVADEPTDLTFTVNAVLLNGVAWEAYPAACFDVGPAEPGTEAVGCGGDQLDNPWRYNVGSDLNAFELDDYSAHSQATGLYHYHGEPVALYEQDCDGAEASPVVGFARDGFPIYGPCFTDSDGTVRAAESSYQVKNGTREDVDGHTTPYVAGNVRSEEYNGQFIGDYEYIEGAGDLDQCNGMTIDGQYGYRLTGEYPYVMACYSGTPSEDFGATR
ncbi:MAG: aryl-sulfate sulfotransferase [Nocardioides sp.]